MDCEEDSLDSFDEEEGSLNFMADENESESDQDSDDDNTTTNQEEKDYTILSQEDVRTRQEEDITSVCSLLSIPRTWTTILLKHYNWNVTSVHENWFCNEEKVRTTVGLLEKPPVVTCEDEDPKIDCEICYGEFLGSKMYAACCGHWVCGCCWKEYITKLINGDGCLILRCPEPGCFAAVDTDDEMVGGFVSDEYKKKHSDYLLRSYVESSKTFKWCPAPGCGCAVEFELTSKNYNVTCNCSYSFCWKCGEDAHLPLDCDTVAKWILKNRLDSRKTDVKLAYSKRCPNCNQPIEKIRGCMHITCACKFEFCWLCLSEWSEHGKKTGGLYVCNCYESAEEEEEGEGEETTMLDKHALERYSHYYERWAVNERSRQTAIENLYEMRTAYIKKLTEKQCRSPSQLNFIIEAWEHIIECRRVLKWSYAYGYYIPQQEHVKIELFEYLQGQAESCLEHLHQCAEEDIQKYLDAEGWSADFIDFQAKICNLTGSTRIYFESLVKALQKGPCDVKCADPSTMGSSMGPRGGKKKRKNIHPLNAQEVMLDPWICETCTFQNESFASVCAMCGSSVRFGTWFCEQCTYLNDRNGIRCEMCDLPRPSFVD